MRAKKTLSNLSRRERQIMDVLYRDGQATAGEVLAALPDPPSYSAVRAMLRILENKGHARHVAEGTRYVYIPTLARDRAGRPALAGVLETFFDGSTEKAVAALLDISKTELSDGELDRLSQLIDQARMEGR
jgi:predicted transcriptional regulator